MALFTLINGSLVLVIKHSSQRCIRVVGHKNWYPRFSYQLRLKVWIMRVVLFKWSYLRESLSGLAFSKEHIRVQTVSKPFINVSTSHLNYLWCWLWNLLSVFRFDWIMWPAQFMILRLVLIAKPAVVYELSRVIEKVLLRVDHALRNREKLTIFSKRLLCEQVRLFSFVRVYLALPGPDSDFFLKLSDEFLTWLNKGYCSQVLNVPTTLGTQTYFCRGWFCFQMVCSSYWPFFL